MSMLASTDPPGFGQQAAAALQPPSYPLSQAAVPW
jgi:hypothetical protein